MVGHEHQLQAADEEGNRHRHVAGMAERQLQRVAERLLGIFRRWYLHLVDAAGTDRGRTPGVYSRSWCDGDSVFDDLFPRDG